MQTRHLIASFTIRDRDQQKLNFRQYMYTTVLNSTEMLSKMESVCSLSIIIINYKLLDTLQALLSLVIAAFSALNEYQRELIYYCSEYWAVASSSR